MVDLPQRPAPPRSPFDTVRGIARPALERISWFGLGRAVAASLCVLAVGAGAFWLLRAPAPPVESSLPFATSTTVVAPAGSAGSAADPASPAAASATTDASTAATTAVAIPTTGPPVEIVVHVAGAVAAPGVYRLPTGSRAIDAVLAAGGATPDADPDAVNLAQVLRDGDRIVLPSVADDVLLVPGITNAGGSGAGGSGGAPAASEAGPAAPIDLNRADVEGLDALPGIGPATAAAIVAYRDEHGPFASVDDLAEVRGIGPAKLEAIRGLVTV